MLQNEVLPHEEATLGPDHQSVLRAKHNIATYLHELGRTTEALQMMELQVRPRLRDPAEILRATVNMANMDRRGSSRPE